MTILVADDHPIYIEGLANLLQSYDFTVVGKAANGIEAVKLAGELQPDIVLMDANMPDLDGIEATKEIKKNYPNMKIIILTGIEDDVLLLKAIQAGAAGFLLKRLDGDSLHKNLIELQKGNNPFSPELEDVLKKKIADETKKEAQPALDFLTEREVTILQLFSRGKTYKEIGLEIHLSEQAIKYNIKKIKEECHVETQSELLDYYHNAIARGK